MFSSLITPPVASVLSIKDAKEQARISDTEDDFLVSGLVSKATAYFDAVAGVTGEALISQTWRLTLNNEDIFSGIPLPIGPVQSVTSVKYYASDVLETLDASNYRLTNGKVYLTAAGAWPSADIREDAIQIEYVCGYGDAASDVPETTRHAITLLVSYFYNHREAAQEGSETFSLAFSSLLAASRSERGLF